MLRIAITPEDIVPQEADVITTVLQSGWDMFHLRHPKASTTEIRNIIEAVPQKFHSRLRLHGHFSLTDEFNLGGIHLNSRCPNAPANYWGAKSLTCHSVDEVLSAAERGGYDYVTLSPIFDSVSKPGCSAAFSEEEIHRALSCGINVIALGGVTPDKVEQLSASGFAGYAVLGYLAEAEASGTLQEALTQFSK